MALDYNATFVAALAATVARYTVSGGISPSYIQAASYTMESGVSNETCSEGGQDVGWIDTGSWMVYPITINTTGNYTMQFRVASANASGVIEADLNAGSIVLGTVAVPNTGGWQTWTTISMTVSLTNGNYNLGVKGQVGVGIWNTQ